jgi:hypothetical protein
LIVGVLLGMLLPAVVSSRRFARRSQCASNLMQVSLAVQAYEFSHLVLPPGVVNPTRPISNIARGYHYSWLVQILPYLEQKAVFDAMNFHVGVYHPTNTTASMMKLQILLCSEDVSGGTGQNGLPETSYAGCHHDVEAPIDTTNRGTFFLNSRLKLDDITDGLSQTFFLGETRIDPAALGWASGTRATLRNCGRPPLTDSPTATPVAAPATTANWVGGFGSYHVDGTNFAFGDGSIHLLRSSISMRVFQLLGNRSDGQLISDDSF